MDTYETIWKFETANFVIECAVTPDYDVDLSFDDSGEVLQKLNDGELVAFLVRMQLKVKGHDFVLADDYLGGCIYASPLEFIDHRGRGNHGSYFSDMVRNVIRQGREEIRHTMSALNAIRAVGERVAA